MICRRLLCLVGLVALLPAASVAQVRAVGWTTYTGQRKVTAVVATGPNDLWAATSGGAFRLQSGALTRYDNLNGLTGLDATAIGRQPALDQIWIGYRDGRLDLYDRTADRWQPLAAIAQAPLTGTESRAINGFAASGEQMLVYGDYGLSILDARSRTFEATATTFGSLARARVVGAAADATDWWVATASGVVHASRSAINLNAPGSWVVAAAGLRGVPTSLSLDAATGRPLVGTTVGLFRWTGSVWEATPLQAPVAALLAPESGQSGLAVIAPGGGITRVVSLDGAYVGPAAPTDAPFTSLTVKGDSLVAATAGRGLWSRLRTAPTDAPWTVTTPPGPADNVFAALSVDPRGRLWAVGGSNGRGFYRLDPSSRTWRSYHSVTDPAGVLPDPLGRQHNTWKLVASGSDGTAWVADFGYGIARIDGETEAETHLLVPKNSPLTGVQTQFGTNDSNYVPIQGIATDAEGNLWATVLRGFGDPLVHRVPASGSTVGWEVFTAQDARAKSTYSGQQPAQVTVDGAGQTWFIGSAQALIALDSRGTPADHSDDGWRVVGADPTSNSGLPTTPKFTALTADREGNLWVGLSEGAAILYGSADATDGRTLGFEEIYPLRDQSVTGIAVDALNRKWVATGKGVWLFSADGLDSLAYFDSHNSPLVSDEVLSIAVDDRTGTVYFGTAQGLSAYRTDAVQPVESTSKRLRLGPNPFRPDRPTASGAPARVLIDGLTAGATVRIVTTTGQLVRELKAASGDNPGGRVARWDGRNDAGQLVASGVYLVVGFDADGRRAAVGKLVVVRN